MSGYISIAGLQVAAVSFGFVGRDVLPGTGLTSYKFWDGVGAVVTDLAQRRPAMNVTGDAVCRY